NFNGIQGFPNLTPGAANLMFLLSIADGGAVDVVGYATACSNLNGYFTTTRMAQLGGQPLVAGSIPNSDPADPMAPVGLGIGVGAPCMGNKLINPDVDGGVAFNAYFVAPMVQVESSTSRGISLDVGSNASGLSGSIEVIKGDAYNQSTGNPNAIWYYFLRST